MSIIDDFVFSTCQLFYDDSINECGKDCKGICGLNEKCYCPSVCSSTNRNFPSFSMTVATVT